jgi:diguanylate cyclase (GGDEF)-like protein
MTPLLDAELQEAPGTSSDSTFSEAAALTFKGPDRKSADSACEEACLVHVYPTGPNLGRRYPLGDEPVLIGRGEDCEIQNLDTSVSRCHARIARGSDGRYLVSDLDSRNGTFVNNSSRLDTFLQDGDYLRVGNCIYRFLSGKDVEAAYHEEIYRLTILDALTQTHNRRYFIEFLERESARAIRHQRPLSVIRFDIDDFKGFNDRMGRLAGDMALRELCARVRTLVRNFELLARYSGEQFALVLPETDVAAARITAEKIRTLAEKQPFAFNKQIFRMTVSAGVASLAPGEASNFVALLRMADENLFRAKQAGRNRVIC